MQNFKTVLEQKAVLINKTLNKIIEVNKDEAAETLLKAMNYTLFSGGKRIRPVLTLMVAEMMGGNIAAARRSGAAIELIHTYSLIHDDLPAMDDDKYRRGQLTNHKVYGQGIAILAGDGLLTYAFKVLSELPLTAETKIDIINTVSKYAGPEGMVSGQVLDLEAENQDISLSQLKKIHYYKTGALFKCAILTGAYCSQPTQDELGALTEYAEHLGLVFQIIDDILDVTGDEEKLGKSTGMDKELSKATYPGLLGLNKSRQRAWEHAEKARDALDIFGSKSKHLRCLLDFILKRDH